MAVNRTSVVFFVVVCLAAALGPCRAQDAAGEGTNMADAQARADTWAEWALNKFSEGVGMDSDSTKDAAQKAVDQTKTAADETSKYASEKANAAFEKLGDTKVYASQKVGEAMDIGKDKASGAYGSASEMADPVLNRAWSLTGEAKDKASGAYGSASEMADPVLDRAWSLTGEAKDKTYEAKEKVKVAYNLAKDTNMAEKAKGKAADAYEVASGGIGGAKEAVKEKAYGASGKGGDVMRMAMEKAADGKEAAKDKYEAVKDAAGNVGEAVKGKKKGEL